MAVKTIILQIIVICDKLNFNHNIIGHTIIVIGKQM